MPFQRAGSRPCLKPLWDGSYSWAAYTYWVQCSMHFGFLKDFSQANVIYGYVELVCFVKFHSNSILQLIHGHYLLVF